MQDSSMCSARSSVNGSRLFDASRDLPGGLHKAVKAVKQHEKDSMRKSLKVEKDEKKRKEKEARQSARLSKKIQKKKQSEEDKTYNSNSLKQLKEEETGGAGSRLVCCYSLLFSCYLLINNSFSLYASRDVSVNYLVAWVLATRLASKQTYSLLLHWPFSGMIAFFYFYSINNFVNFS